MVESKEYEQIQADLLVSGIELEAPQEESKENEISRVIFNIAKERKITWKPRVFSVIKTEVDGYPRSKRVPRYLTIPELPHIVSEINQLTKEAPVMLRMQFTRWTKQGQEPKYFIQSSVEKLAEKIQLIQKPQQTLEPKSEKDEMFGGGKHPKL